MSGAVALRRAGQRVSTITVGSTPSGTVNQSLRGGLFGFTASPFAVNNTAAAAIAAGAVKVVRTDGALQYTPIKAGGVDGAHPTLGHSGSYSYNWTILDAVLASAATDGFTEIYMSIDYTPSILGGATGPSAVTPFANVGWYSTPDNTQVPNDLTALQTIVGDLVHHCTVTKGANMPYWGVWNEPDGSYFSGTAAQYYALYAAVAAGVKSINSALKVGGPEYTGSGANFTVWIHDFIAYCKANSVPLDFVSVHDYSGASWFIPRFTAQLAQAVASIGWATPLDVIIGEFSPASIQNWKGNAPPWGTDQQMQLNDGAAARTAITMMQAQAFGVARLLHFKSAAELTDGTDASGGLFGAAGSWATGNVLKLWAKLSANVMPTTLDADPGIHALATSSTANLAGTVRILIANHHYRRDRTYPVTIGLPGVADGRSTTLWMIDQAHSNQFDAGLSHAELETVPCPVTSGAKVILPPLAARSVCLLEIAP